MANNKIKFTTCESGDWQILELNGEKIAEGHSIGDNEWLELLEMLGCDVDAEEVTDEEMEMLCFES